MSSEIVRVKNMKQHGIANERCKFRKNLNFMVYSPYGVIIFKEFVNFAVWPGGVMVKALA